MNASNLKTFLSLSVGTFLLLVLINLGLPALLLLLRISSFTIGNEQFWLLRWEYTEAKGSSGIQFNLLPLVIIAIVVGLVGLMTKQRLSSRKTRSD